MLGLRLKHGYVVNICDFSFWVWGIILSVKTIAIFVPFVLVDYKVTIIDYLFADFLDSSTLIDYHNDAIDYMV